MLCLVFSVQNAKNAPILVQFKVKIQPPTSQPHSKNQQTRVCSSYNSNFLTVHSFAWAQFHRCEECTCNLCTLSFCQLRFNTQTAQFQLLDVVQFCSNSEIVHRPFQVIFQKYFRSSHRQKKNFSFHFINVGSFFFSRKSTRS